MKELIVTFPKHYKSIPHPFYVTRCDDHYLVSELDNNFNLITERSVIHWNVYQVRRWALNIAGEQNVYDMRRSN